MRAQGWLAMTETLPETLLGRNTTTAPLYKVLLHNDDRNSMDHVVRALMKVFRYDEPAAVRIMLEAHQTGLALCAVEPFEQAEFHRDQLVALSLTATIEQE